jgi:signal transduction histidine kinase
MVLRSERLLAWAGLVAWATVCVERFSELAFRAVGAPSFAIWGGSKPLELTVKVLAYASFGAIFVWVMGPGLNGKRPRMTFALVGLLIVISTTMNTDLAYIVAMTLPCVYPRRLAVICLAIWNLLSLPYFVVYVLRRPALAGTGAGVPELWAVALAIVPHLAWLFFAFAIGMVAATERSARQELAALNLRLMDTQALLAGRARLEERLDIARELHDSVGHNLAALNVQLELVSHLSEGAALEAVGKAHDVGRRLLREVRDVVSAWRADGAIDLPAALLRLADGVEDPKILVTIQEGLHVDMPVCAKALLRCAQEVVTNATRHGNARHIWIVLSHADGWLRMSACDDGQGQETIVLGNGLRGIQERARKLHGRTRFESQVGGGFEVEMCLPEGERVCPES